MKIYIATPLLVRECPDFSYQYIRSEHLPGPVSERYCVGNILLPKDIATFDPPIFDIYVFTEGTCHILRACRSEGVFDGSLHWVIHPDDVIQRAWIPCTSYIVSDKSIHVIKDLYADNNKLSGEFTASSTDLNKDEKYRIYDSAGGYYDYCEIHHYEDKLYEWSAHSYVPPGPRIHRSVPSLLATQSECYKLHKVQLNYNQFARTKWYTGTFELDLDKMIGPRDTCDILIPHPDNSQYRTLTSDSTPAGKYILLKQAVVTEFEDGTYTFAACVKDCDEGHYKGHVAGGGKIRTLTSYTQHTVRERTPKCVFGLAEETKEKYSQNSGTITLEQEWDLDYENEIYTVQLTIGDPYTPCTFYNQNDKFISWMERRKKEIT